MLLKWITCQVPDDQREAFTAAQAAWRALSGLEGFLGQCGGWAHDDPQTACILGLWMHTGAYRHFMRRVHDTITDASGQDSMYESSRVELFDAMFDFPGHAGSPSLAASTSTRLVVEDILVHENRQSHFVCKQKDVVIPALADQANLGGGLLARSQREASRFLTVTWWDHREAYETFKTDVAPTLRESMAIEKDVRRSETIITALDQAWWVSPYSSP